MVFKLTYTIYNIINIAFFLQFSVFINIASYEMIYDIKKPENKVLISVLSTI